ncbi:type III pantothenate kinase [Leptobacterium flavescens]|uniref:Type III pantothenate kinase n=1 Tax=Leptobacterium flavescens TaxID=472055 RepID=A0A6P0UWG7_9FLAO|nr:type III pantothenate kinase [Leptobacterium flavescens]NER14776.1 type III pantothenate kinase [Leptobacterium flavescens]
MNLIVDVGNTFIKLAVFNTEGHLVYDKAVKEEEWSKTIADLQGEFKEITDCIISDVGGLAEAKISGLKAFYKVHVLSHDSRIPFVNKYGTPETLGVDRIALVAAAAREYPLTNTLVIDAGSCITYDFINAKGEYLGGAIAPGLQMRFKALHQFTAKLPLLENSELNDFIGKDTNSSMISGVQNGMINEVEGIIGQYSQRFKDLTVILTGGDTQFLSKRLKNTIFANSKFILGGLNYILEYNKH